MHFFLLSVCARVQCNSSSSNSSNIRQRSIYSYSGKKKKDLTRTYTQPSTRAYDRETRTHITHYYTYGHTHTYNISSMTILYHTYLIKQRRLAQEACSSAQAQPRPSHGLRCPPLAHRGVITSCKEGTPYPIACTTRQRGSPCETDVRTATRARPSSCSRQP